MDEPSPTPLQRGVLDPAYSLVSGMHPMLTFGAWGLSALVGGATMKSALAGTSLTKYGRQALLSPHYGGLAQAGNLGRSIQPFSGQGLLTTSVLERELDIVKNNPATKPHWFKRVRSRCGELYEVVERELGPTREPLRRASVMRTMRLKSMLWMT